jgi:hypothetical protein
VLCRVDCRWQVVEDAGVGFGDGTVSYYFFCKVISVKGVYTRFDKRGDLAGFLTSDWKRICFFEVGSVGWFCGLHIRRAMWSWTSPRRAAGAPDFVRGSLTE